MRVLLDPGEGVVEHDRVALELEVVEALLDVDRGHGRIVGDRGRVDSGRCVRPIRHRCATSRRPTVAAAMPDLDARLELAERTMTALVADAELPPKIGDPSAAGRLLRACHAGAPARHRSERCGRPRGDEMGRRFRDEPRPGLAGDQRAGRAQRPDHRPARGDPRWRADHRGPDGGGLRRRDPPVRAGRPGPPAAGGADRCRRPGSEPPAGPRSAAARRGAAAVRPSPRSRGGTGGRGARHRRHRPGDGGSRRARRGRGRRRRGDRGVVRAGPAR